MYIPDCSDITWKNMSYSQNPETGMYDTRDAAQNILRAVEEAHGSTLKSLPQQVAGGSGSLYDLAALDDTATDVCRPPPPTIHSLTVQRSDFNCATRRHTFRFYGLRLMMERQRGPLVSLSTATGQRSHPAFAVACSLLCTHPACRFGSMLNIRFQERVCPGCMECSVSEQTIFHVHTHFVPWR